MIRAIVGVVLGAVGVVWFLQGIDVLQGSFMTGQIIWAVFGTLLFLAAAWLVVTGIRLQQQRAREPDE